MAGAGSSSSARAAAISRPMCANGGGRRSSTRCAPSAAGAWATCATCASSPAGPRGWVRDQSSSTRCTRRCRSAHSRPVPTIPRSELGHGRPARPAPARPLVLAAGCEISRRQPVARGAAGPPTAGQSLLSQDRSWGMGARRALRQLARWSSRLGARSVVVNPLHAALPVRPQQASPYYPSSRRFRNPLYICVQEAPGARRLGDLARWARTGAELNRISVIDRDSIFALKMEALASCWQAFTGSAPDRERDQFEAYRRTNGDSLRRYATFCVLAERYGGGWRTWPEEFRRPSSAGVQRLAADRVDRVQFHEWLQWVLDRQLARAAAAGVGLIQDLAVGVDPDGADAWAWQDLLAEGVRVGAPADEFNTQGQDWGMPPFDPH